jgi:hypothetical protein
LYTTRRDCKLHDIKVSDIKDIIDESLVATNKKTGKDVTKHLNDYMDGKISKKEFEKLTGIKKESVNEGYNSFKGTMKRDLTLGGKMGSKFDLPKKSDMPIVTFKKGEKVELEIQPNSYHIYGKDGKHGYMDKQTARQLRFMDIDDYVMYESVNEGIDRPKAGDKVQNQYDGVIATIKSIDGNSVTVVYDDMKSLRNEFGAEAKELYNQTEELPMDKFKKAWDRKEYISYGSIKKLGPWANLDEAVDYLYNPQRLIDAALRMKWISEEEARQPETVRAAKEHQREDAEDWDEGEGFGSSDFSFSLMYFMERLGYKMDVKNGKIVKVEESVNEARTIIKTNGKRLTIDKENLERLKSGKDTVGYSTKYPDQEEWILARDKWEIEESVNEANSYDSWKERGNQLEKQAKADAINAFGKAAKRKDFEEMVDMFVSDREINGGEYLDAFRIVLKKYNLEDEFRKQLADLDITKTPYEMNEDVSAPYIYQVGDIVQNVNPTCPHHGSKGIVMSVEPDELTYSVTNSGDTFKPGMRLTKTLDQLEAM